MESLKLLLTYSINLYTQAIGPLMSGILVEILHLGWVKLNLVYFMICFTMTGYEVFVGKACLLEHNDECKCNVTSLADH